jgi:hypothetical protein
MRGGQGWATTGVPGSGLGAAALVSGRRHSPAADDVVLAWLVLLAVSTTALRFPFPQGRYGSVQAFFNAAHAALLGSAVVSWTALIVLLAYATLHRRGHPRRRAARAGHAPGSRPRR